MIKAMLTVTAVIAIASNICIVKVVEPPPQPPQVVEETTPSEVVRECIVEEDGHLLIDETGKEYKGNFTKLTHDTVTVTFIDGEPALFEYN